MKSASTVIGCIAALLLVAVGTAIAGEATLRVGTFDSRGVALAYGRSARPDCMLAKVAELKKEHARAEEKGDQDRVKELDGKATAMQERIHDQVFRGAAIDEILALIEDDLAGIAETAKVDLIVTGVLHSGPGVELVDVTEPMCAPFEPDADTREMIEKILTTPIPDPGELSHDH